jgi:glucose-6-phosphate isomerase
VVVSKTFTTQETLTNSETIKNGFYQKTLAQHKKIYKHFVAVPLIFKKVTEFGINPDNVFQCGMGWWSVFIVECG